MLGQLPTAGSTALSPKDVVRMRERVNRVLGQNLGYSGIKFYAHQQSYTTIYHVTQGYFDRRISKRTQTSVEAPVSVAQVPNYERFPRA